MDENTCASNVPKLTSQEKDWFKNLNHDRVQTVKYLKKAGLIDVFVSHIVDTYRESAHFIFELLQNADDVGATKARFDLNNDGIIFAHNGKTPFSITDVDTERDKESSPGHLNSITTFSLSTKKENIENKIGKFGIGFKSVFQYTDTPHVYNPPFNFKIENYMIPSEIVLDKDLFQIGETTVFWLPFNKEDKTALKAFKEISIKLKNFHNPLLFLRNLEEVIINVKGEKNRFIKTVTELKISVPDISVKNVRLDNTSIILFDRLVNIRDDKNIKHNLVTSIGFVLDEKGNVTSDEKYSHLFKYAWCFFPTYQPTELKYIINAPFILTPNREALKEDRTENVQMFLSIRILMGEAIQGLKELKLINEEFFDTIVEPSSVNNEFRQIANKVVEKLQIGEFIPTTEGDLISVNNAFVCTREDLITLLNYETYSPLRKLVNNPNARIVFRNRKIFKNEQQFIFVYKNFSAVNADLNPNWLGGQYEERFLKDSTKDFILMFFRYLAKNHSSILAINQPLWKKPFVRVDFGSKNKLFVSPNDTFGKPQTYVGENKTEGRYTVVDYLNRDEEIKNFLTNILKSKVPDEFDDFLLSLKKYDSPEKLERNDIINDFRKIIGYLNNVSQIQREKLISELREYSFVPVISGKSIDVINPFKDIVYYPSNELKEYFVKSNDIRNFVDLKCFRDIENSIKLISEELEIETEPYYNSTDDVIDGLEDYLVEITLDESIFLARLLINYIPKIYFGSKLEILRTYNWLYDKDSQKKLSREIKQGELHESYTIEADSIHSQLGFYLDPNEKRYANLNEYEKMALEALGDSIEEFSPQELQEAIAAFREQKKLRSNTKEKEQIKKSMTPKELLESWTNESFNHNGNSENQSGTATKLKNLKSLNFWDNEHEEDDNFPENPGGYISAPVIGNNYKEEQKRTKQAHLEKELQLESLRNELIEIAQTQEPYSFGWFNTLLELEDNFTMENRIKKNPVRVVFSNALLDEDGLLELSGTPHIPPNIEDIGEISIQLYFDDRKSTIKGEVLSPKKRVLKIKLSSPGLLDLEDLSKIERVVVLATSPDFILEKLKSAFSTLPFEDTDNLKNSDIIPNNISFIFGPPGTGKTTYLSWLIGGKNPEPLKFNKEKIEPILDEIQKNKRVLVLTPTNKAADVLTEKIIDNYVQDGDYPGWLIRFGQTGSLDNESVFVGDRKVKPWIKNKCALVTTIARFPYDGFSINYPDGDEEKWPIKDFNWDYIIFDEASMIHQAAILYTILYANHLNKDVKFIIGGDPFQIPPIIQFEFPYWSYIPDLAYDQERNPIMDENGTQISWKQDGGNIYSFVGLMKDDSFRNPRTEPHQFNVHNLITQFRSLPPIGELFSKYRYDGILKHFRGNGELDPKYAAKKMSIKNLSLSSLNIVRFPVKKYEGIYRSRAIKGSPYQIYSALFTVELIKYIQDNIEVNGNIPYRIGIISPYSKQNTIVTKLLEKIGPGTIEIVTGTVHGFQGDECDMVIVILNPPRNISRSIRSFLNKKNILNVAISRARDKMILMVPHDSENEVNIHDLHQIKYIESLAGKIPECKNEVTGYFASDIEEALWGSKTYIEDNAFHTSHQDVNIYADAVKRYEIRQDENAVDVQVKWK